MRFKSLLALGVLVGACSGSQFETTGEFGGGTGGDPGTGGKLNGSGGGPRSTGGLAGKSGGAANSGGVVGAATGGVPSSGGVGTAIGGATSALGGAANGGDAGVIQPGMGGAVTATGGSGGWVTGGTGSGSVGGAVGNVGGGFSGVGGSVAGGTGGFASGGTGGGTGGFASGGTGGGFASGGTGGANCNALWNTYAQALEKARSCTLGGQNQCGTDKGLPDACNCKVPVNSDRDTEPAEDAYNAWLNASCQHSVVCLMPCTSIQSSVCTATSNGGAICKPSSGPSSG